MADAHPPVKARGADLEDASKLERIIDDLLVQYLDLLDEYTKAREDLSKTLSAGFLSLADANFTAPRGTRYGRDFFDDRMKAHQTVQINENGESHPILALYSSTAPNAGSVGSHNGQQSLSSSRNAREKSEDSDARPDHDTSNEPSTARLSKSNSDAVPPNHDNELVQSKALKHTGAPTDPLHWFGVFVSPKLRSTQAHFTHALETAVTAVTEKDLQMKRLEVDIRRARKFLAKIQA